MRAYVVCWKFYVVHKNPHIVLGISYVLYRNVCDSERMFRNVGMLHANASEQKIRSPEEVLTCGLAPL